MRRVLLFGLIWTVVVLVGLVFWPSSPSTGGCWRSVQPTAGCLAQQAEAHDREWWTQTLPMLVFFASGYMVVGAMAVRRLRLGA